MNKNSIVILGALETAIICTTLIIGAWTLIEVRRDPLDVNRDGEANIVDLSVLAAELNERGQ